VLLTTLLDAFEVFALILNRERQILFANADAIGLADAGSLGQIQGQRPGEVLGCERAWLHPEGCGASPLCESCGVSIAVQASQLGREAAAECLLTVRRGSRREAREFRVKATPLSIDGAQLTVVSLRDISAEKRRDALERLFFHDLLNTISALHGYTRLLLDGRAPRREYLERVALLGDRLRDEVLGQRALLAAEGGTLELELEEVSPGELLAGLERVCAGVSTAAGKSLRLQLHGPERALRTDPMLLTRVLVNMVRNACEATAPGGEVELHQEGDPAACRLRVWNASAIPPAVATQIFKRSFSTKGNRGRGLGTYSMKLLGERYLGGEVGFTSSEQDGTSFWISLPWEGPARDPR
jgi:signal transduction histidine kinase